MLHDDQVHVYNDNSDHSYPMHLQHIQMKHNDNLVDDTESKSDVQLEYPESLFCVQYIWMKQRLMKIEQLKFTYVDKGIYVAVQLVCNPFHLDLPTIQITDCANATK